LLYPARRSCSWDNIIVKAHPMQEYMLKVVRIINIARELRTAWTLT
jgi:hypothetical protein